MIISKDVTAKTTINRFKTLESDFIELYGDKYNYDKSVYSLAHTKIEILCNNCRCYFHKKPAMHLRGQGCPKCSIKLRSDDRRKSTEQFIKEANHIHKDKYNYSLVEYTHSRIKVKIICNKHGIFEQSPTNHICGSGCFECGIKTMSTYSFNIAKKEFETKAKAIHGNKYLYNKSIYAGSENNIKIWCNEHKEYFFQKPHAHLKGQGCPKCSSELIRKSTEQFIKEATHIHKDKYEYSLVEYTHSRIKVKIICNKCENIFSVLPYSHLNGGGCPKCAKYGFNPCKSAILYYLSINNGEAYKIGITNKTVNKRYNNSDMEKITIIKEWDFTIGQDALNKEQLIKNDYKTYKWRGDNLLKGVGITEMFNKDILGLD